MSKSSSDYEITIETLAAQPVLSMRFTAAREQLAAKFAEVLPAVYGHAMAGPAKPAGPPFARYYNMGPDLDVEAGVPTAGRGEAQGDILVSELPAGPAAVTTHVGPYDGLGAAYEALFAWATANDRRPGGAPWEVYISDPGQQPDPNQWQTRVILPLAAE